MNLCCRYQPWIFEWIWISVMPCIFVISWSDSAGQQTQPGTCANTVYLAGLDRLCIRVACHNFCLHNAFFYLKNKICCMLLCVGKSGLRVSVRVSNSCLFLDCTSRPISTRGKIMLECRRFGMRRACFSLTIQQSPQFRTVPISPLCLSAVVLL